MSSLSAQEEAQLLQTIEMFEVIAQSQPQDYQSLEILKEAYSKLGKHEDVISTSKRIAEAYVQLGQLSSAILEYESILQQVPDDPDVQKALTDIENRATNFTPAEEETTTTATEPEPAQPTQSQPAGTGAVTVIDDGRQAMEKLFVDANLISSADFEMYWPAPDMANAPSQVVEPFLFTAIDKGMVSADQAIKLLCEKTRLGFVPIDKYDVDVEVARSFPVEACKRWCVLPFDKMSKSVMVATTNPFNKQAMRELEEASSTRLLWYIAFPAELMKEIERVFR